MVLEILLNADCPESVVDLVEDLSDYLDTANSWILIKGVYTFMKGTYSSAFYDILLNVFVDESLQTKEVIGYCMKFIGIVRLRECVDDTVNWI